MPPTTLRAAYGISPSELNWVAGFLEGEGCFRMPKAPGSGLNISASQVQRFPLDTLLCLFGGSIRAKPYKPPQNNQWVWTLIGIQASGLMMTLYALMSPRRREQIATALTTWRTRQPANRYKTRCVHGHSFTLENTRVTRRGQRQCKACARLRKVAA